MINYYRVTVVSWTKTGAAEWTRDMPTSAQSYSGSFGSSIVNSVQIPVELTKKYEILLLAGYKSDTSPMPVLIQNRYYFTPNEITTGSNQAAAPDDARGNPTASWEPALDYTQCEFDLVDGGTAVKPTRDTSAEEVMRIKLPRQETGGGINPSTLVKDDGGSGSGTAVAWASSPAITVPIKGLAGILAYTTSMASGGANADFPSSAMLSTNTSSLTPSGQSPFNLKINTVAGIPAGTNNSPLPQGQNPYGTGEITSGGDPVFTAGTAGTFGAVATLETDPATPSAHDVVGIPLEDCEVFLQIYATVMSPFSGGEAWAIMPGTDATVDQKGRSGISIVATFGDETGIAPITTQSAPFLVITP
jgi:hypothetical protein